MRPPVRSVADAAQRTSSDSGNPFRRLPEGGVGSHSSPRLGNIHKVDASLLELPLLLLSFPDGIDIGSEAKKEKTFCRNLLNLLRANGDGAGEGGSDQQDGGCER